MLTTNPTSTTIFKSLIALKPAIRFIFSFHPSAQQCSAHAAQIVRDAVIAAGAPETASSGLKTVYGRYFRADEASGRGDDFGDWRQCDGGSCLFLRQTRAGVGAGNAFLPMSKNGKHPAGGRPTS